MAVPDFQTLMLPVLRVTAHGPIVAAELRRRVAELANVTEEDLAEVLPSGRHTKFSNRVAWANVHLQRAGLIGLVRRGVYEATPAGKELLAKAPQRIDMKLLGGIPAYTEWRAQSNEDGVDTVSVTAAPTSATAEATTPEERIDRSYRELRVAVEAGLLTRLRTLDPMQFEQVVIDLLVAMGYGGGREEMAKAFKRSADNGVDGVVREDKLGLDVVYMQAKRYAADNHVDVSSVRDFAGSLEYHRATKGVFVTTSRFTASAKDYVSRIGKRVVLIDGGELARHMVDHRVGVRVKDTYEVFELDEDAFSE
ncbi:MAG: restriction endonuclease [Reyranella sp.]|nr:MAG: restriction endonuclease [Reyranella sp.]